jgi:SAM-dependent methyltransferase
MKVEVCSRCILCNCPALDVVDAECNIAQCAGCGYVFDNPRPVLEELVKFYSRPAKYDSWLGELGVRDRVWKRRLRLILPFRKEGSLLDLGTGIGQFLAVAKPHFKRIYGTEISTTAIGIAKEKYGLELFEGTIDAIATSGMRFDNISLFHVLEHVPDPASLLRTCHSLLSSEGILIIAVPNEVTSLRASLKRFLVRARILRPRKGVGRFGLPRIGLGAETNEVHLSHFTPPVLNSLLRSVGFVTLKDTLDPHYVRTARAEKLKADFYYCFCLAFRTMFGVNIYDAMLVIAQKQSLTGEPRIAV